MVGGGRTLRRSVPQPALATFWARAQNVASTRSSDSPIVQRDGSAICNTPLSHVTTRVCWQFRTFWARAHFVRGGFGRHFGPGPKMSLPWRIRGCEARRLARENRWVPADKARLETHPQPHMGLAGRARRPAVPATLCMPEAAVPQVPQVPPAPLAVEEAAPEPTLTERPQHQI